MIKVFRCACAREFSRRHYQRRKQFRADLIWHFWSKHKIDAESCAYYVDHLGADTVTKRRRKLEVA